jgi:hypothetical protein
VNPIESDLKDPVGPDTFQKTQNQVHGLMARGNFLIIATVAIFLCYQATCGDLGNFNRYFRGHSLTVAEHDGFLAPREVKLRGENAESAATIRQTSLNACFMELSPCSSANRLSLRGGAGSRTASTRKSAPGSSKAAASGDRVIYGSQKSKHVSNHRSRHQESEMSSSEQSEASNSGSSASQSDESEEDVVRDRRSKSGPSRRSKLEVIKPIYALTLNFQFSSALCQGAVPVRI